MAAENVTPARSLKYHLQTLWLFNRSDLKTVVFPQTTFGIFAAASGLMVDNSNASFIDVAKRLPLVILWVWALLLVESISNQRLPASVVEDAVNKPWRPMPAQRLTPSEARRLLLLYVVPATLLLGHLLSVGKQTLGLIVSVWIYNDLGGSDEGFFVRNLLNAAGLTLFSLGATIVASGGADLNARGYLWLYLLAVVIFSTIQMQDLPDMEGDAAKGRKTLPLVQGESITRFSVAATVLCCSFACPNYWQMEISGYIFTYLIGGLLSVRVLLCRNVSADKQTWKLWCVWMACLYSLPMVSSCTL